MVGWFLFTRYDRQLFRDLVNPTLLGLGAFSVVSAIDILFYLVDLSVLSGIRLSVVLQLILFKLPAVLMVFSPICGLIGCMVCLIRMNQDSEWLVLQTSGVSPFAIMRPFLIWGMGLWLIGYSLNESIIPLLNYQSNQLIQREIERKPPPQIAEKVVFKGTENRFFYIQSIRRDTGIMSGITVIDTTQSNRIVTAKIGKWGHNQWQLFKGNMYHFGEQGELLDTLHFNELSIRISQSLGTFFNDSKAPSEMDSNELKQQISRLSKEGRATHELKVEQWLKYSMPAGSVVLVLVGVASCFMFLGNPKEWRDLIKAISTAAITVLGYYVGLAICRSLGKSGSLAPWVAAWMSNMVVMTLAIMALFLKRQK